MARVLRVAAAQTGPVRKGESKEAVVARLVALLRRAHGAGCRLVVFPELALTYFFPGFVVSDQEELDALFEREMPNEVTQPLFDTAAELGVGFYLGYAELTPDGKRFNTTILVDEAAKTIGKFRKMHIPGNTEPNPDWPIQQLELRYFTPGDLGFPVWDAFGGRMGMAICYDRRWPETYRVMRLRGVELVMIGYNTQSLGVSGRNPVHRFMFQHLLSLQAGAYYNGIYVVATAKSGYEEGVQLIGGSCIVAPSGEIVARAEGEGEALVVADIDLDHTHSGSRGPWRMETRRRPEHYGPLTEAALPDR